MSVVFLNRKASLRGGRSKKRIIKIINQVIKTMFIEIILIKQISFRIIQRK